MERISKLISVGCVIWSVAVSSFVQGQEAGAVTASDSYLLPPVDVAVVAASRHVTQLVEEAALHTAAAAAKPPGPPPPLSLERVKLRLDASNGWYSHREFNDRLGGPSWPERDDRDWVPTVYSPQGFTNDREAEIRAKIVQSEAGEQEWDVLWDGSECPPAWVKLKSYMIDPPPAVEDIRKRYLDDFEEALKAMDAQLQLPTTAGVQAASSPLVDVGDIIGVIRPIADDWNELCLLSSRASFAAPPGPAAADRSRQALAVLERLEAHHDEILMPLAEDVKAKDRDGLRRRLDPMYRPLREVDALLRLADEFPSRRKAEFDKAQACVKALRLNASIVLNPDSSAETATAAQGSYAAQWTEMRRAAWELAILHRRCLDIDSRLKEAEMAWRASINRYYEDVFHFVGESVGQRLGMEIAAWDVRNHLWKADLPEGKCVSPGAADIIPLEFKVENLRTQLAEEFYGLDVSAPNPVAEDTTLYPQKWDDERQGFPVTILNGTEGLRQITTRLWKESKASKIELYAHRLQLQGAIDLTPPEGISPPQVVIYATEVECEGVQILIPANSSLTIITHRLSSAVRPGARSAVPPVVVVHPSGKFRVFASDRAGLPKFAMLSHEQPETAVVFATADPNLPNPWGNLFGGGYANLNRHLNKFWLQLTQHIRLGLMASQPASVQRGMIQDLLAIPPTYQIGGNDDAERGISEFIAAVSKESERLLGNEVVSFDDSQIGRRFYCLSRFENNNQVVYALPDEVIIDVENEGRLGEVTLLKDTMQFEWKARLRHSDVATARIAWLAKKSFPRAQFRVGVPSDVEIQLEDNKLDGVPLSNRPHLLEDNQPIVMQTSGLTNDGVRRLQEIIGRTGKITPSFRLWVVSTKNPGERLGDFTVPMHFCRSGKEVVSSESTSTGLVLTNTGLHGVFVDFACDSSGTLANCIPPILVPPGGRVPVGPLPQEFKTEKVYWFWRADVRGLQIFDAFSVRDAGPQPFFTATLNLANFRTARFPSVDGQVGAGKAVDLRRSMLKVAIVPRVDRTRPTTPTLELPLSEVGRSNSGWQYTCAVPNDYSLKVELSLYPRGDEGNVSILEAVPKESDGALAYDYNPSLSSIQNQLASLWKMYHDQNVARANQQ